VPLVAELALSAIVVLARLILPLWETSHQRQRFCLRPFGR
jgi:hypothetical protein